MRPYETLSPAGQARRVRPIAEAALARFGLAGAQLSLVQHEENTVYRADVGPAGREGPWVRNRYAVRVHAAWYQSAAEVRSELAWLHALAGAGVPVPGVVRTGDGAFVAEVDAPDALGPRVVSVLQWLRGRQMHTAPPVSRYAAVGEALARIHDHAAGWDPPPRFTRLTWDWDGLFGASIVSAGTTAAEAWPAVPEPARVRWRRSADRFAEALAELGRSPEVYSLIHGDFHIGNLLYGDGEIRPLDFNDCGWGWHLYDYAVALGRANRLGDRWEEIGAAFWAGYGRRRAVPEPDVLRHLDLFLAARTISLALWVIGMTRMNPEFAEYVPYMMEQTEAVLDAIGSP